ncbi:acyltransferase family protein [Arthrobacter sp. SAFR-014]|uniref:acyltransferase family protein n=1 Tax=unclassified Arthrobacter TaxID=235627 RepID=UPI003F7B7A5D
MSTTDTVRSAPAESRRPATGLRPRRAFRADIQALRAVAVMLVVLDHLGWVPGGYVGVDIFFVISGFLITAHLLKELTATGKIRLGSFYARRVRRLLPAAFTVLAVGTAAAMMWQPYDRWAASAAEMLASTFYAENWVLAAKAVDYSASSESATFAQHYWSLSVEEQFYLAWPLLLLALFWAAARFRKASAQVMLIGIAAALVTSLVFSVVITSLSPSEAYFVTPARVWEFGAGALVALGLGRLTLGPRQTQAIGFAGWALIAFSAVTYNHETPFPGWLALVPVLGTAFVILAGSFGRRPALGKVLGWTPVQYLGDVSYSLYLWHWPIIVVAPFALGRAPSPLDKVLILVLAILLAAVTKALVEDRGQRFVFLTASRRNTFGAMAVAMALLAALCFAQVKAAESRGEQDERAAAAAALQPCRGPAAMAPGADCADRFGPISAAGSPEARKYWKTPPECARSTEEARIGLLCDFSKGKTDADVVWLVGDSHAQHWQAAVFAAAKQRRWIVKTAMAGGCPVADVHFIGFNGHTEAEPARKCRDWARQVTTAVAEDRPQRIFTSAFARKVVVDDGSGTSGTEQIVAGLHRTWQRWTDAGAKVDVLADPPLSEGVRAADCSVLNVAAPAKCAVERSKAQPPDPLVLAAQSAGNSKVTLVDLTDYFCDAEKCYNVVGGVAVYYDPMHLNREFSELFWPMIVAKIGKD